MSNQDYGYQEAGWQISILHHLKYLIGKLTVALQEETSLILINDKEAKYLKKYQEIVIKRCKHLLEQSELIHSMGNAFGFASR